MIKTIKQIKLVVDGTEYSSDEILRDKSLYKIIQQNQWNLPNSIIDDVISENGIIKIITSLADGKFIVELEGVSPQLYDRFLKTKT